MSIEYSGEPMPDEYVVRFTADWCQPCKIFAPFYDEASKGSHLPFFVVDVDKYPELAQEFGIRSIPAAFKVRRQGSPLKLKIVHDADQIINQLR